MPFRSFNIKLSFEKIVRRNQNAKRQIYALSSMPLDIVSNTKSSFPESLS